MIVLQQNLLGTKKNSRFGAAPCQSGADPLHAKTLNSQLCLQMDMNLDIDDFGNDDDLETIKVCLAYHH